MKVRFSIRYKFLTVTTFLLIGCVALYLLLASTIFSRDKIELVYDLNKSTVTNLSSELDAVMTSVLDKMELFALLSNSSVNLKKEFSRILENDPNIVFLSSTNQLRKSQRVEFLHKNFGKTYGVDKGFFSDEVASKVKVPLEEIKKSGLAYWNATIPNGPPIIGVGRSVIQENSKGLPVNQYAVISYVRLDRIVKLISELKINQISIVDDRGEILVSSMTNSLESKFKEARWSLFELAKNNPLHVGVLEYKNSEGYEMLGGFSKSKKNNFFVLSRVPTNRVFAVVDQLINRSIVFGLIVVTFTFIAAILFSRSITRPLDTLVGAMRNVSKGSLSEHIVLKTSDETAVLAQSYNTMIDDLKKSRDQLGEINRDLEQNVKDRTAKLEEQNRAVKQAQEALIKTTRLASVGEIAGRAAHEILNPLTSIMTRIKKVSDKIQGSAVEDIKFLAEIQSNWENDYDKGGFDKLVEEWKRASDVSTDSSLWDEDMANFKDVNKSVEDHLVSLDSDMMFLLSESQRISKIVQSMRSLSIVKGRKASYGAHKLLKESVNIMADLFSQAEIEIEEHFAAEKDQVLVDKDEFIQSLTNLLRNSLQAVQEVEGSEYKPKIGIITRIEDKKLVIDVVDNGPGIDKQYVPKLFETQFSTKDRDEGTGLGLSISRRFIRAYGGDITYIGEMSDWKTTFRIVLPLHLERGKEVAA